jgi:FG-GAP repeat protein
MDIMIRIRGALFSLACFGLLMFFASGTPAQNAYLTVPPQDGQFDGDAFFGAATAISGRTAAVGALGVAPPDTSGNPQAHYPYFGVVNIYTTDVNRTAWTLSSILHAPDADSGDVYFGTLVAMQGKRLIVSSIGAVWLYERIRGSYALTDKIVTTASPNGLLYRDGVLVVRANEVQVYKVNDAGVAHLSSSLSPPLNAPNSLNGAIAYDPVNEIIAIGSTSLTDASGAVYFYGKKAGQWVLQETLPAPAADANAFGYSVAVRGNKLVVGAPYADSRVDNGFPAVLNSGAAYVYTKQGNRWLLTQKLATDDPASPVTGLVGFGTNVATNGRYVWIQAPYANDFNVSTVQVGYSTLFRWNRDQLELFRSRVSDTSAGGLAMSNRYVIEGAGDPIYGEWAGIYDLTLYEGSNSSTSADDPEDAD